MKKLLLLLSVVLLCSCGSNNDQTAFLEEFYNTLLKNGATMNIDDAIMNHCTPKFQKFLKNSYSEAGYEGDQDGYAMWEFIPQFETDGMGDKSEVKKVSALEDNWYKVEYFEQGEEGTMYIKFVEFDGTLKMDDITDVAPVIETAEAGEETSNEESVEGLTDFKAEIKEPDVFYYAILPNSEYPNMLLAFQPNKEDDNFGIATRTFADIHASKYNQDNIHYEYSIEGDMLILHSGEFKWEENGQSVKADDLRLKIIKMETGFMLKGTWKGHMYKFVRMYIDQFSKDDLIW